jgi:16S rRNA G1207 methylase RsmC
LSLGKPGNSRRLPITAHATRNINSSKKFSRDHFEYAEAVPAARKNLAAWLSQNPQAMAASSCSRPELSGSADAYYDATESKKYTGNSRIIHIQTVMAERCLELLALPENEPKFILDIGCGSGLSGG